MRSKLDIAAILCAGLVLCLQPARAQEVSVYLGLGGAHDISNSQKIETFGDGTLYNTPGLGGLFADSGASVFFGRQWGIAGDICRRLTQANYAGIHDGVSLFSFDAIYRPARARTKRLESEYRLGLGATRVHYSFDDGSACAQIYGCPVSSHLQVHFSVAERIYVSDHVFVRPAIDLHYVNNFSDFGNNWVPRYSVDFGYAFGR